MGKSEYLTYKGKPLVRCGKTLYYGSMADKYVIKMDVKDTKKSVDLDVGTKVTVQLMYTDPNIRTRKQIVKSSEKPGLLFGFGHRRRLADQSSGRVRRFKNRLKPTRIQQPNRK